MRDTKPTAEYIAKFYKRQESRYGPQAALDQLMLDMYLQENVITAKKPDRGTTEVKRVKSGLAGLVIDQDTSVLSGSWIVKVAPRGNEKQANDVLEPFAQGALAVMEEEDPVRAPVVQDFRIYGRGAALGPLPDPRLWGDEELQKLVTEMNEAEDSEKFKSAAKAVEEFKATNFPIFWQHISAASFYPAFHRGRELAECVWVREMWRADAESEFPELSESGESGGTGSDKVKVYEYANQRYVATVVEGKEPKLVRVWEHGMTVAGRRVVPVCFDETDRLPENGRGWVWKGALFHLRELVQSYDETLTDLRTNIRDWVTSPPVVYLDMNQRAELEGPDWRNPIDVKPGVTVNMLAGETVGRFPVAQLTQDAYNFLNVTKDLMDQVGVARPSLVGEGSTGESAVRQAQSNAIAKAELKRPQEAVERFGTRAVRLVFASVVALNREFPDSPDKIYVRHKESGGRGKEIAATPKDVEGYFHLVDVSVDLNLPINRAGDIQNASVAVQSGILDFNTAREIFVRVQNPQEIDERIAERDLFMSGIEVIKAYVLAGLQQSLQGGDIPVQELVAGAADLPATAQEAIAMALAQGGAGGGASPDLGNVARGANNSARAGRPQQMSDLSGTDVGMRP